VLDAVLVSFIFRFNSLYVMMKCMLVEVCCENGVSVSVYNEKVVESFFIGDLWLVVFENGKCIVEWSEVPELSLVLDGLGVELVKIG
jgi:hypothetical protein